MKIVVNTLNSRIETDNPDLFEALYNLYSEKAPGYQYSPAYKRRQWDGKTHFISKGGVFRTGLINRILDDLKKVDCEPELILEDSGDDDSLEDWDISGFTYYDYQSELINMALARKHGIVKAPTGAGKTLIMAGLVKALAGRKMVLLFNAKQILTQSYDFLTKACGMDNIGICYGEGYVYGDIMLCTIQSVSRILDTHLEETTLAALRAFPKASYRIGFTATPPTEIVAKLNLEGALGAVMSVVDTSSLVEEGTLTRPLIQLIDRPYSASGVDEDMSYLEVYEEYIVQNEERNNIIKEIVNDIRSKNEGARILILTKSLLHGRTLENLLGGECQFLEGCNSIGDRYAAISRFRGHDGPSVLIGTKILQTGINIEEITHFINARGMKSEIATLQALGRALRRHDTKEVVFVYDFLDKEKYLKPHANARKRHYKKEGHEVTVI